MAVDVHEFIDKQIRILESEIRRGYVVAAVLGSIAVGLLIAAFVTHPAGAAIVGVPSSVYGKFVPTSLSCFAGFGTYLPLKLIAPTQRRILALRAAKTLPRGEVIQMVKKAAELAIAGK